MFVEPDGRLGIIDFGPGGTVDGRVRSELGRLLVGVVRGDPERLAGALLGLGTATGQVERAALRADLSALLARYRDVSLGEISLRAAIADVMELLRRHRLRIPRDLALLVKVEGLRVNIRGAVAELAAARYAKRRRRSRLERT